MKTQSEQSDVYFHRIELRGPGELAQEIVNTIYSFLTAAGLKLHTNFKELRGYNGCFNEEFADILGWCVSVQIKVTRTSTGCIREGMVFLPEYLSKLQPKLELELMKKFNCMVYHGFLLGRPERKEDFLVPKERQYL